MRRAVGTAVRVLRQLGHDHRSVALVLVLPSLLLWLFSEVFAGSPGVFDRVGPQLLGIFPFTVMFLVTSVTMVRERTSGTLERILTTPLRRAELVGGYALAFGLAALAQAGLTSAVAIWVLGLELPSPWVVVVLAVVVAVVGTALGLLTSAFARTEFQAVQFMPLVVIPQVLLCGLLAPREDMAGALHVLSDALPLSYATDAFTATLTTEGMSAALWSDLGVLVGFGAVAVGLASLTLRRRTP
ncbi:ABC transporter permease [Aeromicrobium sp. CF4.19]|uniref:ABC transporter permease n=1 Tax=Aeromicrobium sp. CF4.19 TaxID=3373082 RepID=UPI003EE7B9B1